MATSAGEDLARRYLIHNIRVEQKHAEYWVEWARRSTSTVATCTSATMSRAWRALVALVLVRLRSRQPGGRDRCDQLCGRGRHRRMVVRRLFQDTYAVVAAEAPAPPAMRWLRVHAEYDDTHPWEALEIVATLLGHAPPAAEIDSRAPCRPDELHLHGDGARPGL